MSEIEIPGQPSDGEQPVDASQVAHVRALLRPVNVGVGKIEQSDERLLIIGPFLLELHVPLPPDLARSVAQHLAGGVVIASPGGMPRMDVPKS